MRKRFLALQKTYPGESFFTVKLLYCVLASLPRSETRVLSAADGDDEVFCRQDKLDSVARVSKARIPRHEVKYRRHKYGRAQRTRGETANRLDVPFNSPINQKLHF